MSAPRSPSTIPQNGPGPSPPSITNRMPLRGPQHAHGLDHPDPRVDRLGRRRGDHLVAVLQLECRVEVRRVHVDLERPLGQAYAERCVLGDLGGEPEGVVEQAVVVDHRAHEAAAVRLVRRDRAPGEHPVGGDAGTDDAGEVVAHAHLGARQAQANGRVAEGRRRRARRMSAARDSAIPPPTAGPLTAAITGWGTARRTPGSDPIISWNPSRSPVGHGHVGHARAEPPQVEPRTEAAPGPGEHHDPCLGIGADRGAGVTQGRDEVFVQTR